MAGKIIAGGMALLSSSEPAVWSDANGWTCADYALAPSRCMDVPDAVRFCPDVCTGAETYIREMFERLAQGSLDAAGEEGVNDEILDIIDPAGAGERRRLQQQSCRNIVPQDADFGGACSGGASVESQILQSVRSYVRQQWKTSCQEYDCKSFRMECTPFPEALQPTPKPTAPPQNPTPSPTMSPEEIEVWVIVLVVAGSLCCLCTLAAALLWYFCWEPAKPESECGECEDDGQCVTELINQPMQPMQPYNQPVVYGQGQAAYGGAVGGGNNYRPSGASYAPLSAASVTHQPPQQAAGYGGIQAVNSGPVMPTLACPPTMPTAQAGPNSPHQN